jgi:hypothetical protein
MIREREIIVMNYFVFVSADATEAKIAYFDNVAHSVPIQ